MWDTNLTGFGYLEFHLAFLLISVQTFEDPLFAITSLRDLLRLGVPIVYHFPVLSKSHFEPAFNMNGSFESVIRVNIHFISFPFLKTSFWFFILSFRISFQFLAFMVVDLLSLIVFWS